MFILKYRKIFYSFSALIVGFSIFAIFFWGINFGIDFTGGSVTEFKYQENIEEKEKVQNIISDSGIDLGNFSLRQTGETGYILRTKNISEDDKNTVIENLKNNTTQELTEVRFSNIGPTLGSELKNRALLAIFVVVLAIVLFIAYVFRRVSKPVSSWNYGLITIIAFLHDVLIPIGMLAVMGQFGGVEVDTLFVVAILVVLGYSINDTIVVFDRVRENLGKTDEKLRTSKFKSIVSTSLKETISRSINTSLTTIIALFAIYFFGGEVTKIFALTMMVGVIAGTYSSIFLAAPMLVSLQKMNEKKALKVIEKIS
jgi:preprotein translocase subunit SecF